MNDRSNTGFQVIFNVDAGVRSVRRSRTVPRWLILNIGLKVFTPGVPTEDFELVDIDGVGVVEPGLGPGCGSGPKQTINLSHHRHQGPVLIIFKVLEPSDLNFPHDVSKAIGIKQGAGSCPTSPDNYCSKLLRKGVSTDGKLVGLQDKNDDARVYRFALFLHRGDDPHPVAVCDPHIINK